MPYCKSCGAYIPDGQNKCLACGYDEEADRAAQQAAAAASAAAVSATNYSYVDPELKEKLEEERRRKQEENRRWAEEESARREQRREAQEWARKEAARRRTEQRRAEYTSGAEDAGVRPTSGQQNTAGEGNGLDNIMASGGNKVLAAMCYLSFLFVLPWIFTPTDKFATYHAKQGLILFIAGVILDMIGIVAPFLWIFRIYFIFKGMYNALNGIRKPLPVIGKLFGDT